jgi:hypothetical protein
VFAAPDPPGWETKIEVGSAVRVTMKTEEAFDAIWMGRDGDRAVFERFEPHETIIVPIASVRRVRDRQSHASSNAQAIGALGAVIGFLGGWFAVVAFLLPRT